MPIGITAIGGYIPDRVIDNQTLANWTGATPEWIEERTGVHERRYAERGVATSDLALAAVEELVRLAPGALTDVGAIIVATSTPDHPQPSTAVALQAGLGLSGVPAFDLQAVCSGFVYALIVGVALAETGLAGPRVLVVGADKYSAIVDRSDPRTATLFGDGAGAALLEPVPDGYGLIASGLVAEGGYRELVRVPAGGTRRPLTPARLAAGEHFFQMHGREVADYVMRTVPNLVTAVLDRADVRADAVDRFVFHQANPTLLRRLAAQMAIDPTRVPMTAHKFGNSGAASLPVTLWDSDRASPLRTGDLIALAAVGGGLTAGAAVLRWYTRRSQPTTATAPEAASAGYSRNIR